MAIPEDSELDKALKDKQKESFDTRHRARDLPPIPNDIEVWITSEDKTVQAELFLPPINQGLSVVETPTG